MNLMDEATLLKMAEAEILKEAKQAAVRHSIAGVSGWQPCPKPSKLFLTNTLMQTMASNRLLARKQGQKGDKMYKRTQRKLLQQSSKTDLSSNFVYQKPKKNKEKSTNSVTSSKLNRHKTQLDNKYSSKPKESKEKSECKKIKLKKV